LWVGAPFANPIALISIGFLTGNADTTPVNMIIGCAWGINFGFYMWLYWEGYKINIYWSSTECRSSWWEPILFIAGTPVFAVMECLGIVSGIARFVRGSAMQFTVIEKPL
jgi:hypothetical protein